MAPRTALILIDLQVGNLTGPYALPTADALLNTAADLLGRAREANITVAHVQNIGGPGDPDDPELEGFALHPAVTPRDGEIAVRKRTPDAFLDSGLHNALRLQAIKRVVMAGLPTEFAVDTTVRRAFSLGYRVTLAADGHSTWPSRQLTAAQIVDHHNRLLADWFAEVLPAADIHFDPASNRPDTHPT
jgi:nicotinamidase-related amidase